MPHLATRCHPLHLWVGDGPVPNLQINPSPQISLLVHCVSLGPPRSHHQDNEGSPVTDLLGTTLVRKNDGAGVGGTLGGNQTLMQV